MLSKELLDILRCPESKSKLILVGDQLVSTDPNCRRVYSIIEGTPILLPDKSLKLTKEEWEKFINNTIQ